MENCVFCGNPLEEVNGEVCLSCDKDMKVFLKRNREAENTAYLAILSLLRDAHTPQEIIHPVIDGVVAALIQGAGQDKVRDELERILQRLYEPITLSGLGHYIEKGTVDGTSKA